MTDFLCSKTAGSRGPGLSGCMVIQMKNNLNYIFTTLLLLIIFLQEARFRTSWAWLVRNKEGNVRNAAKEERWWTKIANEFVVLSCTVWAIHSIRKERKKSTNVWRSTEKHLPSVRPNWSHWLKSKSSAYALICQKSSPTVQQRNWIRLGSKIIPLPMWKIWQLRSAAQKARAYLVSYLESALGRVRSSLDAYQILVPIPMKRMPKLLSAVCWRERKWCTVTATLLADIFTSKHSRRKGTLLTASSSSASLWFPISPF